jgi:hypothetical protein
MKFSLSIDLGNASMHTSVDLATANRIEDNGYVETCEDEYGEMITRGIQDVNGNHVGSWSVWDESTSMTTPDKPLVAHHTIPYDDDTQSEYDLDFDETDN